MRYLDFRHRRHTPNKSKRESNRSATRQSKNESIRSVTKQISSRGGNKDQQDMEMLMGNDIRRVSIDSRDEKHSTIINIDQGVIMGDEPVIVISNGTTTL